MGHFYEGFCGFYSQAVLSIPSDSDGLGLELIINKIQPWMTLAHSKVEHYPLSWPSAFECNAFLPPRIYEIFEGRGDMCEYT